MAKKYLTEEEKLEARRAYSRKWKAEHKQKIAEYMAKYRQEHKAEIAEQQTNYRQEHKKDKAEYDAKYRQVRKDEIAKYNVKYNAKYYNTKEGRARFLIKRYKQADKKYNRGDCDLTVPWFIENIFTKCIYCGESDWKKLGCDRIDNSKGHAIGNVVPCCGDCNNKRHMKPFEQFYCEMKHKTLGNES